jgi:DNA-binding IclR family transcriptional regulator
MSLGWAIDIENAIIEVLKRAETSLTISEISRKINAHRATTSKYLAILEAKGTVKRRDVGKAKLYYLENGPSLEKIKMV